MKKYKAPEFIYAPNLQNYRLYCLKATYQTYLSLSLWYTLLTKYVAGRLLKQGWSVDRRKEENNHSLMATFILNKKTEPDLGI